MHIAEFAVKRPITVLMVVAAVFLLGIVSLPRLQLDLLPQITLPVVTITTIYPGAGPEEVEEFVTKPLEDAAGLVKNLDDITSYSVEGMSMIIVSFKWGTDIDYAATELRDKIDPVIEYLPEGVHRPVVTKMDISSMMPTMTIGLTGRDERELKDIADNIVKRDLEKVNGVAMATPMGGLEREIRVVVDPERLKAFGIPLQQINQALALENLNIPSGTLKAQKQEYTVRVVGQFKTPQEIENITIGIKNHAPILLKDVAKVEDTVKEPTSYARVNGKPAVVIPVYKQSVANTVEVSRNVRSALKEIQKRLPTNTSLTITMDQAEYIEKSIKNLEEVAIEGAILATIIILLFLTTIRSTFIVALSIPFSLCVAFIYMYFTKSTLNIVTMGGLVIAIGRIIDDSIVALENIHRHMERGEGVITACIEGVKEVGMPIVAATLTTIAVFLPIAFITGLTKELFTSLVAVFAVALLASMVAAYFVVPMLSSRLLRPQANEEIRKGLSYYTIEQFQRGYRRVEEIYRRMLAWVLRHRKATVGIAVGSLLFGLLLIPLIGLEFFPTSISNAIMINLETPIGSNLEETLEKVQIAERHVKQLPDKVVFASTVGSGGTTAMRAGRAVTSRNASVIIRLKPLRERKMTDQEMKNWLRERLKDVPNLKASFMDMGGALMGGQAEIEVEIRGDDLDELIRLGNELLDRVKKIPGVYDVDLNWEMGSPEYHIVLDRQKAGTFGVTAGQIGSIVSTLIKGSQVSKFRERGKEYDITVQAPKEKRRGEEDLKYIPVLTPTGVLIPLNTIAKVSFTSGPSMIPRHKHQRAISVTAAKGGRALGDIIRDIQREIQRMSLPPGYSAEIRGQEKQRREAFSGLFTALIAGIFLIYIILASQFESLVQPLIVMTAIPLSLIGVMLALFLTGQTFSVISMLGILMLAGIVISNSVLLVQFINLQKERGLETKEAIMTAGPIRLRPILMTALGTIFAMIPMALAMREGSEMFKPLAIVVLGGLTTSTFLTLLVVPVIYSIVDEWGRKLRR